jgi:hypothetical protein
MISNVYASLHLFSSMSSPRDHLAPGEPGCSFVLSFDDMWLSNFHNLLAPRLVRSTYKIHHQSVLQRRLLVFVDRVAEQYLCSVKNNYSRIRKYSLFNAFLWLSYFKPSACVAAAFNNPTEARTQSK